MAAHWPEWTAVLLATSALHCGFQATVTLLVYPALAEVPAERWGRAHQRHSRRVTPLVAMVYAACLIAGAGALVVKPSTAVIATVVLTALVMADTALIAAPLHGRLGRARTEKLVAHLLLADRARLVGALLALAAAVWAAG